MIGSLMMRVGVVLLVIGLLWGIEMGIRQDFALAPAHAHLNLVGGVLLFVFGLYYRLLPGAAASPLATVQGWLHIVGAIVFPLGVAIVIARGESLVAIPIIGSLLVVMGVGEFDAHVLRKRP